MKQKTGTVNCMIAAVVLCVLAELIGPLKFEVAGIGVTILTMIWVIIMGILLSPMLLGKLIPPEEGSDFCHRREPGKSWV